MSGRIRLTHNFKLGQRPGDKEVPYGPSETVPDETMTVQEIIKKYVTNQRIDVGLKREGAYNDGDFDDMDMEKVNDMDLFEKEELLTDLKRSNQEKINFFENQKQKAKPSQDSGEPGTQSDDTSPAEGEKQGAKRSKQKTDKGGGKERVPGNLPEDD